MTSVNTNIAGLTAQYNLKNVNRDMETTMERLSTGKKINSAGDDAAGAEALVMDLLAKVQEFAEEKGVSMELEGDEDEGDMEEEDEGDMDMEMDDAEPEGGEEPAEDDMEMDLGAEEDEGEGNYGNRDMMEEKLVAEVTKRVAKRLLEAAKRKK